MIADAFAPLPMLDRRARRTKSSSACRHLVDVRRSTSTATLDASARLSHVEPFRVDAVGDALVLSVQLPFTERDDVRLGRTDEELFVTVGPHRRALVLPDSLVRREVGGARFVGDRLDVEFV